MSSGCCGTKKPKLNGAPAQTNGFPEDHHHTHEHHKQSSNNRSSTGAGSVAAGGGGGGGDRSSGTGPPTRLNQQNKVCSYNGTTSIPNGNPRNGLIPVACPEMCFYCFDVLYSHLHNMEPPGTPDFTNEPYPLFVTWKVGKDKRLRGCMGTFSHINLHQGLREYAATSAFKDSRFQPIGREELPRLGVSVSILRHFEEGRDFRDWDIGVHGIRIEFLNERGAKRTATYLPEVAPEQGWDHEQTIDSLLRKGGYKGPVTSEVRRSVKLTRYQSEKISVTSQEYMSYWRNRRC